jgi:uncharacterized protein (TIGR03435 family)
MNYKMKIVTLAAVMLLLTCTGGAGLVQNQPLTYEVTSIKPSDSGRLGASTNTFAGLFKATNATLRYLIQYAYSLKDFQVAGGPGWIGSEKYDIEAKSGSKAEDHEFSSMMRSILADRFQLKFHRETRELPVYALVLAKGGPKLAPALKDQKSSMDGDRGELTVRNATVVDLASILSNMLDRKVVENTGLTGHYNLTLKWTPDESQAQQQKADLRLGDSKGPSIFTAIQEQLGLKLESTKAPIEVLVIDSAQKPSGN